MSTTHTGFWGTPNYRASPNEVTRFIDLIRELTGSRPFKVKMRTSVSALEAIITYVAKEAGPREALAILDALKRQIEGEGP